MSKAFVFIKDNKRAIYYKVRNARNKMSIHHLDYNLDEIHYYDDSVVYVYYFDPNKEVPRLCEETIIDYNPVLGKKTCKKCIHKTGQYCAMRGTKVKKNSYYKCLYWMEKECI